MIQFCEYVIEAPSRQEYLSWVGRNTYLWREVELAENTVQPGVFVELRRPRDDEEAAQMEKERRGGRSDWTEMEKWVKGGKNGIRIWTFRPVIRADEAMP